METDEGIELGAPVEDYTEGVQTTRIWASADACPSGITILKPYSLSSSIGGMASHGKALWSRTRSVWRSARGYGKGDVAALAPCGTSVASAHGFGSPGMWNPDPEAAGRHGAIYYNSEPSVHDLPHWLPPAAEAADEDTKADKPGKAAPMKAKLTREMLRDNLFETVTCVTFSQCGTFLLTTSVIKDRNQKVGARASALQSAANLWRKVPHDGGGAPESPRSEDGALSSPHSGELLPGRAADRDAEAKTGWRHVRTFAQTSRTKDTGHFIHVPAATERGASRRAPCTINAACFSANGKRIVTAGDDGTAIVWSLDSLCSSHFRDNFNTRTRLQYGHPCFITVTF